MESSTHSTFSTQSSDSARPSSFSNPDSTDANTDAPGIADRAKNAAGVVGDKLSDAGSAVRSRAGVLKTTVADALQSGAERIRQQSEGGAQLVGAPGAGATAINEDSRLAQASNQVAEGMQAAADWVRDADLDGLQSGIARQVKENPGRSLAVALGIGYLLGKAFRK